MTHALKPTEIAQAKDHAVAPWYASAQLAILDRVADARRHAEARSLGVARQRMDELERTLAQIDAIWPYRKDGILPMARSVFYHDAFRLHRAGGLDSSTDRVDLRPTPEGDVAARTAPIRGTDQLKAIKTQIATAMRELHLVAAVAHGDPEATSALHEGWETRTRGSLTSSVKQMLSDSQIALHEAVGNLLVKPEYR